MANEPTASPGQLVPTAQQVFVVKPPVERRGTINDLRAWIANPSKATEGPAKALLAKCGPLVVDGYQYELVGDTIKATHRSALSHQRMASASGIDRLGFEG